MTTTSVNTDFPGYEILSEIGRSNARVVKARHIATGSLVAIKHFALDTDADTLVRFAREADIMTAIDHPNVVKIREVSLAATLPFIAMDYVEGGDLRSLLKKRGCLDIPTTIRLGLQMTEALNAIHPVGIIHRDIKPGNILYRTLTNGELHFLLTDFGIARLQDQTNFTKTGQSLMTYEYASPEQFDNPKAVTPATDYYSLGVVLYECVSGKVPFSMADTGLGTFIGRVMREAPAPTLSANRLLPASLDIALFSLLVKTPGARLHDADELELLLRQSDVERLQRNRPVIMVVPEPVVVEEKTKVAPVVEAVVFTQESIPAEVKPVLVSYGNTPDKSPPKSPEIEPEREGNFPNLLVGLVVLFCITVIIVMINSDYRTKNQGATPMIDSSSMMIYDSAMADSASSTMMGDSAVMTADTAATMSGGTSADDSLGRRIITV